MSGTDDRPGMSEHWVSECAVLYPEACAGWAEQVLSLRSQWTARHVSLPFYTLGMAAYLDAVPSASRAGGPIPYHSTALRQHHNRLLQDKFAPLLDLTCEALGRWAKRRAHCNAGTTALPGFHIHLEHPLFMHPVASKHRDLQFQLVFPGREIALSQVLTFTLPLSLPEGAGMNLWSNGSRYFHPYHLGQMTVHSGLAPHQAVLFPGNLRPPRIMLQGHGLIEDDSLLLYW